MKSVINFLEKKRANEKITMITCYDFTSARIIDKTDIDCILVGDSAVMVMHGFDNTTFATMDMLRFHTAAVAKGAQNKFIIADLPFMSYRKTLTATIEAVQTLIQAGADAVKLEGAEGNLEIIKHIVESGVPVMGHLGLTPQSINMIGGHKVQGKDTTTENKILEQAKSLENAGCFAVVLECVPAKLAQHITKNLSIPTIGIGAGADTDGQVLVFQDLLGLQTGFKPKFLKHYLNGEELFQSSINQYVQEVQTKKFPASENCY